MPIRTPVERTYYPSSPGDESHLLCWLPRDEMERMLNKGQLARSVLENWPWGLEVEVDDGALAELGIRLPARPALIKKAYKRLRTAKRLDPSGCVCGEFLERLAQGHKPKRRVRAAHVLETASGRPYKYAPVPAMSFGSAPMVVFRQLATCRGACAPDR